MQNCGLIVEVRRSFIVSHSFSHWQLVFLSVCLSQSIINLVAAPCLHGSFVAFIQGECLSNPDKCTAGLTFGVRIKLDDAAKNYRDEPHYIVDSGGSNKESRGFTLFVKDGKLYAVVSVPDEVWRVGCSINSPNNFSLSLLYM